MKTYKIKRHQQLTIVTPYKKRNRFQFGYNKQKERERINKAYDKILANTREYLQSLDKERDGRSLLTDG